MKTSAEWNVFVSSVFLGYEEYRRVAQQAIELFGAKPTLVETTLPAISEAPQGACLEEVQACDVMVIILGSRYGGNGVDKSPTHEEWDHARELNKPVLVFKEDLPSDTIEEGQRKFLAEIGDWHEGTLWKRFSGEVSLLTEIIKALQYHRDNAHRESNSATLDILPPSCRGLLRRLAETSPNVSENLHTFLASPSSRQADALARYVGTPPEWMIGASYLAWEILAEFAAAHHRDEAFGFRQRAIDAGSPDAIVLTAKQAVHRAEAGDQSAAESLVSGIPSGHPLLTVVTAKVEGEASSAVAAIRGDNLTEADDPEVARFCLGVLLWAYMKLEDHDSARALLRNECSRKPNNAWLHLHLAAVTHASADIVSAESPRGRVLLNESIEAALKSRDLFRSWNGPSTLPLALAIEAHLMLGDQVTASRIGSLPPYGEATEIEARDTTVKTLLAHAFLMLGEPDRIDSSLTGDISESEAAFIRAMQALSRDEPSAVTLMRQAVALADTPGARRRALQGLAACGEYDEVGSASCSEPEKALFAALAASSQNRFADAVASISPFWLASTMHAHLYGTALSANGQKDQAVTALLGAAEHFGVDTLREAALGELVELSRTEEAEAIALELLVRHPSPATRRKLHSLLVSIAGAREDWRTMEARARAQVEEFSDDSSAAWAVVYALHRQAENRLAWGYIVAHDLFPIDEETARIAITVCRLADAPAQDARPLLEIAEAFTSEKVQAAAISTILASGDGIAVNEEQQARLNALAESYFARYPEGEGLRRVSAESEEELLDLAKSGVKEQAEQARQVIDKVRFGRAPYGALRFLGEIPYAELLLGLAARELMAISPDSDYRELEQQRARSALRAPVVADTSIAALGIHASVDVLRMASAFSDVIIPDELLFDARHSLFSMGRLPTGMLIYDFGSGQHRLDEPHQAQRAAMRERAEACVDTLEHWQAVSSGGLSMPNYEQNEELRPWDATIRLALHNHLPIWSDDLALRSIAVSEGIETFGTWALYEALASETEWSWMPSRIEMACRFLRGGIADVPITPKELLDALDAETEPDRCLAMLLRRPAPWLVDPIEAAQCYYARIRQLIVDGNQHRTPTLLYAACQGLGRSISDMARGPVLAQMLAGTILISDSPELVPSLLGVARYASNELSGELSPDPLELTVLQFLQYFEELDRTDVAARAIRSAFSQVEQTDLEKIMSIVFDHRR